LPGMTVTALPTGRQERFFSCCKNTNKWVKDKEIGKIFVLLQHGR